MAKLGQEGKSDLKVIVMSLLSEFRMVQLYETNPFGLKNLEKSQIVENGSPVFLTVKAAREHARN